MAMYTISMFNLYVKNLLSISFFTFFLIICLFVKNDDLHLNKKLVPFYFFVD